MYEALIRLHEGTPRQGPGDDGFSVGLLGRLPDLPSDGAIADLGCGTGVASVLLAQHFRRPVLCVDIADAFLKTLSEKAEDAGVGHLLTPLCADMGTLDPQTYQFALLWSEGAAYNLTFEGALRAWRPLMVKNGIAVISELSWFGLERPREVVDYWGAAYPEMADERVNRERAERHGFELVLSERLPTDAWWTNYYNPLLAQLDAHAASPSRMMRDVIAETRQEIELFRNYSDMFGYTFYILKAV